MNNKMKITGLILAGYMLGRTKKLGLALTVASAVAGTTAAKNRDQLLGGLKDFADSSPELKSLQEKITGRLAESGKSAAKAVAAKGVDQLSVKLQEQTEKMKSTLDDTADSIAPEVDDSEGADDEENAPESEDENVPENSEGSEPDEVETTEPQETDEEPQAEEEAPKKPAAKRSSTANRSAKGTRSSKSSTASRGSRAKSGSKSSSTARSSTAKKTSSSRAAAKSEGADDE